MKKANIILVLLVIIIISLSYTSYACTSFAVYSDNNLYGMNFDYPDTEIRFIIHKIKDEKAFSVEFQQGDEYIPFTGMSTKGLFVAVQMLYPSKQGKKKLEKNEVYIGELGALIGEYEKVEQIKKYIDNKKLVNMPIPYNVHQLFADNYKDAMIVEVGKDDNKIIKSKENYTVMTNFSNSELINKLPTQINGVGYDRYKTAYEYIKDNCDKFNLESGFEVLKRTVQLGGRYPTQCSMIFDPQKADIYLAVKSDFEKIWKISLEKETIQSIKGFEKPIEMKINSNSFFISELVNISNNPEEFYAKNIKEVKAQNSINVLYFIFGLALIFIIIVTIKSILKKKKFHS